MGNVKENFKRSCLNGGMIAAVVIPLALFAESLYEGGLLQKTDVDILSDSGFTGGLLRNGRRPARRGRTGEKRL